MAPYTDVVARRVVAHLLDIVMLVGVQVAVFFAVAEKGAALPDSLENKDGVNAQITLGDDRWFLEGDAAAAYIVGVLALWFLVYAVMQGWSGRTPAKALLGLRVVKADGTAPGVARAFVRSLMWIVDAFPYLLPWLTGFVAAAVTPAHQRLGDKVADTYVVDAPRLREVTRPTGIAGLGGE